MTGRFPFTSFPIGWFQVAYSHELPPGGMQTLHYFGRDLVLFRSQTGTAHVLEAYCPHLGAHLGAGRIEGGVLRCPFHGWRFDGTGACVHIPYCNTIPPGATVGSLPVVEANGFILVGVGPDGAVPPWPAPAPSEPGQPGWSPVARYRYTARTHVQEVGENLMDHAHFGPVHGTAPMVPTSELLTDGRVLTITYLQRPQGPGGRDLHLRVEGHGLGIWLQRFMGKLETLLVTTVTPIDEERIDVRLTIFAAAGQPPEQIEGFVKAIIQQSEQDLPIVERKVYQDPPLVCAGDGPIVPYRAWCSQFYGNG